MKIIKFFSIVFLIIIFNSKFLYSQGDNWFHYTVFNSDLPSNIVNYVEVDKNNVKWVASGPKLVRLVNQHMEIFSPDSSFNIYELGEIAIDKNDNKWIRSLFHGVLKFDRNGLWYQYNKANGFPGSDTVTAVSIDSNNRVWVGSFDGVSMWDGVSWTHYSGEQFLPHRIINALEVDKDNNLWIGTFGGLVKYDGQTWKMLDTSEYHLPSYYIISLDINTKNEIFIGTRGGVAKFDGEKWININPTAHNDKLNNNVWTINALERDLWIGFKYDYDRIAAKYDSNQWFFFGPENSALPPNDMQCIAVDDSNHVFFATYRGGLVEFWDDRSYRDSSNLLVADFVANPLKGYQPLTVQFTDKSAGKPSSWKWDFGDNTSSTEKNPLHTYQNSGTYTVTLMVSNINDSDTLTKVDYIVVLPPQPGEAYFVCNPLKGCNPLTVSFTDKSTGSPLSWYWDFGDDNNSTLQNPIHTYTTPGIYSIELTVQYHNEQSSYSRTNFVEVVECDTVLIDLITPYNGAKVIAKSLYPITWEVAPNINYVNLWLSTDNGLNWQIIANNIKARPEKMTWSVPNIEAPYCLMKIEDAQDTDIYDINTFAIITKINIIGKDTLKICADDNGEILKTNFKSDPNKTYRITFQGTFSLHDRINACPNEGDLSCGLDAAYVYDIEQNAINQGLWPPLNIMSLPQTYINDSTYTFGGDKEINLSKHIGFRFNGQPLAVGNYNKSHQYIIEKQGTNDYFYFSIIDSLEKNGITIPQYQDNSDCISIIIEEIDTIEVDYCGFEFIRDSIDTTKIIGMQLDAGIYVRDTMSITGKRNILGEIDPDELGVVVNGRFICPIDSIVCDDITTRTAPPVSFGLIVDKSNSMNLPISENDPTIRINALKSALINFIQNLRDDDRAFLLSFNTDINIEQSWTTNKSLLIDKVNSLQASGWTKLWGAVDLGIKELQASQLPRAMILLSDGGNTEKPFIEEIQLLNKVKNTVNLPIYVIALGLSDYEEDIRGRDSLKLLAEASGGKLFDVNTSQDLSKIYNDILMTETLYECCRIYFSGEIDTCGWVKLVYSPERDDIITRAFDYCGYEFINTMIHDINTDEMDMSVSPNPLNNSALIDYLLPLNENVELQIIDMLGNIQFIKDLGFKKAGKHSYIVDAGDLISGSYFAVIKAGNNVITRKVIIIR